MNFIKAKAVWLRGRSQEKNVTAIFRTVLTYENGPCLLRSTGAAFYRILVNGSFLHFGPARAAHGYARIDILNIAEWLIKGKNTISFEVAGYYCPCFNGIMMPSFLQAEVTLDGKIVAFTGGSGGFVGIESPNRIQKVLRYSSQRQFVEAYRLDHNDPMDDWITRVELDAGNPLEEIKTTLVYLEREVPYPDYEIAYPTGGLSPQNAYQRTIPCSMGNPNRLADGIHGFLPDEIETNPREILEQYEFYVPEAELTCLPAHPFTIDVRTGEYTVFTMDKIKTGFMGVRIIAMEDSSVYLIYDEKLTNGKVYTMCSCINIVQYELKKSDQPYSLLTFEPYSLMFCGIFVRHGSVQVKDFHVVEFAYPRSNACSLWTVDDDLSVIYNAAVQSFRHNTLDVPMDCPSRERSAWLSEAYFNSFAEPLWGRDNCVERAYMNNIRVFPGHKNLPPGMLPPCYPAEVRYDGLFIPQWSMWYVLELDEYLRRDPAVNASSYKKRCYDLLYFFDQYINSDGLLENLPSWNFIEWSDANKFVQDVNYPTNMLFARVIEIMGQIYHDDALTLRAGIIRETIIRQSFRDGYFMDNAVRNPEGQLQVTNNCSEVCQYYAFCMGTASEIDKHFSELLHNLIHVFGPKRKEKGILPHIAHTSVFMGQYLRMMLLFKIGEFEQMLGEMKSYFAAMARYGGTLWEGEDPLGGSMDHGFTSVAGVLILKALAGIMDINERSKTITLAQYHLPYEADIRIPLRNGSLHAVRIPYEYNEVKTEAPCEYTIVYK